MQVYLRSKQSDGRVERVEIVESCRLERDSYKYMREGKLVKWKGNGYR